MFIAKEKVLDRIEQSFLLSLKNPIHIFLPLMVFNIVMIVLIPNSIFMLGGETFLAQTRISTAVLIGMALAFTYFLVYITVLIPITLATIKNIIDTSEGKTTHIQRSLEYGFSNIGNIFSVYWYIFAYVYLAPALIFIAGGFLLLFSMVSDNDILRNVSFFIMIFAGIYALIQGVYKGVKTKFCIYGAIAHNNYGKENFHKNISITSGKWWRIIGNFLVVGIIGGLVMGLISGIINAIGFLGSDISSFIPEGNSESFSAESLNQIVEGFMDFNIFGFIKDILSSIVNGGLTVFIFVFSYVFYKRLYDESNENTIEVHDNSQEL